MTGRYIFILLLNFKIGLCLDVQNAVDIYACSSTLICLPMDSYDDYLPKQVTTKETQVYYLKQYPYENVVLTEQKK